jgi:CRISPR-associated protein Csb1
MGHRSADAGILFSDACAELEKAYALARAISDAALAKINPTALIGGVWGSRSSGVKKARIIRSEIMARDVTPLTHGVQYFPSHEHHKQVIEDGKVVKGWLPDVETGGKKNDPSEAKEDKSPYAQLGLVSQPVGRVRAGVVAHGLVTRRISAHLEVLRHLRGETPEETLCLRRYILGLTLVALTAPLERFLRSGCTLIPVEGSNPVILAKYSQGLRKPVALTHEEALAYALEAAKDFGVGPDRLFTFDAQKAHAAALKLVKDAQDKKNKKNKVKGKGKDEENVEETNEESTEDSDSGTTVNDTFSM